MAGDRTRPHTWRTDPRPEEVTSPLRRPLGPVQTDDLPQPESLPAPDPVRWTEGLRNGSPRGRGLRASRQAQLLGLQRAQGNRAVQRLLRAGAPEAQEDQDLGARLGRAGAGSALQSEVQGRLEAGLGADLSGVRVHADSEADSLARAVQAQAFTSGQDIYFRSGAYDPASAAGLRLLAHEATHTVQQAAGPVAGTPAAGSVAVSDPADPFERQAAQTADRIAAGPAASVEEVPPGLPTASPSQSLRAVQRDDPPGGAVAPPVQGPGAAQQPAAAQEPDREEMWREIEQSATMELLIKLQEIGRAAAEQTKGQIDSLFQSYEDSLESDQTFLSVMGVGLAGAGNSPAGSATGGLAGAATAATQLAMQKIMDFKSVGQVKERARSDIGGAVNAGLTSDSDTYSNFEAEALNEMRDDFDQQWDRIPPEQRLLPPFAPLMRAWFPRAARSKYGVSSTAGQGVLGSIRTQVAGQLAPVRRRLDELQEEQRLRRTGAGALGGAVTGAIIGGTIGSVVPVVGTAVGAVAGGVIGGIAGAVGGYFW